MSELADTLVALIGVALVVLFRIVWSLAGRVGRLEGRLNGEQEPERRRRT